MKKTNFPMTVGSTMQELGALTLPAGSTIRRLYGNQTHGRECFVNCVRFISAVIDGFPYEDPQFWELDEQWQLPECRLT